MKKYTCKDARRDVRFAYSRRAEEMPNEAKEAFDRFRIHAFCFKPNGGRCSRCLAYHHKIKTKHGF